MKYIDSKQRASLWYYANKDNSEFKDKRRLSVKEWRIKFPERYLWQRAKDRSQRLNLEFTIQPEDIIIPTVCPVFHTEFKCCTPYAASLDRIEPSKGYVKDNVQVISRKANLMKQNASKNELKDFALWVLK